MHIQQIYLTSRAGVGKCYAWNGIAGFPFTGHEISLQHVIPKSLVAELQKPMLEVCGAEYRSRSKANTLRVFADGAWYFEIFKFTYKMEHLCLNWGHFGNLTPNNPYNTCL